MVCHININEKFTNYLHQAECIDLWGNSLVFVHEKMAINEMDIRTYVLPLSEPEEVFPHFHTYGKIAKLEKPRKKAERKAKKMARPEQRPAIEKKAIKSPSGNIPTNTQKKEKPIQNCPDAFKMEGNL
jgi:hypothetical protein